MYTYTDNVLSYTYIYIHTIIKCVLYIYIYIYIYTTTTTTTTTNHNKTSNDEQSNNRGQREHTGSVRGYPSKQGGHTVLLTLVSCCPRSLRDLPP